MMTKDLQSTSSNIPLLAGISNHQVIFQSKKANWNSLVTLQVVVPITTRGAHMSRLIANHIESGDYIESMIRELANKINRSCNVQPIIIASFKFPWRDQFADVKLSYENSKIIREVSIYGITACPCSKEEMGIGHMQRCKLTVVLDDTSALFEDTLESMEMCFSCVLKEKLKRPEEADMIRASQDNPKFVEDVVRSAVTIFGKSLIETTAESMESIHSHNAIAIWRCS